MRARAAAESGSIALAITPCAVSIQVTPSEGGDWFLFSRCERFSAPATTSSSVALKRTHVRPVKTEPFIVLTFQFHRRHSPLTPNRGYLKQPMFQLPMRP